MKPDPGDWASREFARQRAEWEAHERRHDWWVNPLIDATTWLLRLVIWVVAVVVAVAVVFAKPLLLWLAIRMLT